MKSKHIRQRMSQRGIRSALVDIVLEYGTPQHDGKRVLDRKTIKGVLDQLDQYRQVLQDAERKGGVIVVEADDVLITTYNLGLKR